MPKGLEEDYSGDSKEKGPAAGGNSLFPLSFAQERIWLLDQLEPNSATYNLPMPARIRGRLDEKVLSRTLNEIARRHEPLRTTIAVMDAEPVQVIPAACKLELSSTDLSGIPAAEREKKALQLVQEDARKPFNLAKDLMIRAQLLRLGENDYILAVNAHHIATDGWSIGVFYNELHILYEAFLKGKESPLPELAIQYADFGVWQRQWLQGAVLEKQISFWKGQLAGAPALVELPSDLPRPAVQSYRGSQEEFVLDKKLTGELKELSHRERCTFFMVLITAFKVLIHRYTGMTDILVGSPIANRNQKEIEGLIGCFNNTLVLRTDLSETPTFREALSRVREVTLEAYGHQDLPFEKLVEELQPVRDRSYSPLFQLMFILQNTPPITNESENFKLERFEVNNGTTKFDLGMELFDTPQGVTGIIEYATDLFLPETIRQMVGHWKTLLTGIVANPAERINQLPILTAAETRQLVHEWNATTREYPKQSCVHELVEAQAARTPDAVAVEFEGKKITLAEVNRRANQVARQLAASGVAPGLKVGIYLERSIELVIGILAIAKAGGAYVPLDPKHPEERLKFIMEDAQLKVLLTQKSLVSEWNGDVAGAPKTLCIDDGSSAREVGENLGLKFSAESVAYVLYTSGSTGRPKGVQIRHRALVNSLTSVAELLEITDKDVWLGLTTLSFDIAGLELWSPLINGGKVLLASAAAAMDGKQLTELIGHVTIMQATPATWRLLIEAGWKGDHKIKIMCGGEPWSEELAGELQSRCGELWNMYGPTETTILSAAALVKAGEPPLIGAPIANTQLYILDKSLQVVPIGVPGELHIGGDGLAEGYWRRDELTKEKFIKDPFRPGGRLYKTGDLVRYRPGRKIEFLGRMDHQVKVRGYRIELGEIQTLLSQHEGVSEAVVVVREDTPGGKRIVGYVVPKEEGSCNTAQLRQMLKEKLPDYMVPSVVVQLPSLPMTPNLKVDRKALPAPGPGDLETKFIAPRNPIELQLAQLWEKMFGISPIGIRDNFFEVGGHSLLATQLISRVREAFGVELPLRGVFEAPTLAGLSERVGKALQSGQAGQVPTLVERSEAPPLSFAQERLWLLDQLEPNSPAYNVTMPARIRGRLDEAVLSRALNEIVRRHEPLRTTFEVKNAEPVQVIATSRVLEVPLIDLSGLCESERESKALQLLEADAGRPFNLAKDLMIRAQLLRLGESDHILALNIHHIATDGWSLGVFYKELHVLYEAFLKGKESPLPELAIQYADFGVWQRQWLQGAVLEKQLSYWKGQLAGVPALVELPSDLPRPAVQSYRGSQEEFVLDRKLTAELKELSHRERCTFFMVLITAFKVLIHRYTGMTDILVGSPIANRNQKEIEGLIGCFNNTLVLRTDLSETPTFREALSRVREVTLGAYGHQDLPFEKLVEELQPVRDRSYSPLFQLMFILQNTPPITNESESFKLERFEVNNGTTKYDLTMALIETPQGVSGIIQYATDLFLPETVLKMIGHWKTLLTGIVANPAERINQLPILTTAETRQLVHEWNATARQYPKQSRVQELVEAQAARSPGTVAVEFEGRKITFAELNLRANQTARRLVAAGVGTGVKVGICLERSIELVIGLLAIAKTGGAYIPLDPNYPRERLKFIVEDAQLKVLLTQKSLEVEWREIKASGPKSLCIDDASSRQEAGENLDCKYSAESTAYILYTSGSTGKPKGVPISHRALVNFLTSMREQPGITEKDVWLAVTTLSFDIAGLELWLPLTTGAKILLANSTVAMDGKRLIRLLEQASIMQATPATWRLLIEAGWKGDSKLKILCGGEAWSEELAAQLHARCGELWNMYGPTETTIWSAAALVKPDEEPLIGPPIANTQLYVLDKSLQIVPVGVAGELHIGGDGLSNGYWQRDELTKEKFIDDPFNPGQKLYKTGDLVCYRPGRKIKFLGRMDNQVKLRGYRIELGEIQSLLSQQPEVRDAVVIVREDVPGEKRMVAYVVAGEEGSCNTEQLRQTLKQKLPDYMVPSVVMQLPSLPMTPNRKVDRKALPVPGLEALETKFVAPRDPLELQLAQLWEKVFGISPIGIRDNFFQLGGHSLLAVRMFVEIERMTGKNLPLVTLFQSPTIEKLAGILHEKGWQSPWSSLVPIKPDGSKPPFYCVHGVGGNILEYMDLAKYMEKDQPFYGLQAAGLDGKRPWHKSVEEMAAHYIDEIRAFQPRGPYYIGGSSFGGLVAFEMARQFEMRGEQVALLAFFDTYAPGYPKFLPNASGLRSKLNHQIYRAELHWGNLKAARGTEKFTYVQLKAKRLWRSEVFRFNRMRRRWREKMDNMFFPKAIRDAQKTGWQAACIYVPSRYSGNATLFRATGQMMGIHPDPTLGWGELVGGELAIYDTPGHHGAIVREPRARVLSEQLKDCLRKAQTAASAGRGFEKARKLEMEQGGDWEASELAGSRENTVAEKMATT